MEDWELIEALIDGPRNESDLPGTPLEREQLARTLRMGGVPVFSWGDGVYLLTPAGYDYALQYYGLEPFPSADDLSFPADATAQLKERLERERIAKLEQAGKAVDHGGDWLKFFRFQLGAAGIGVGLSAALYGFMIVIGYWPKP